MKTNKDCIEGWNQIDPAQRGRLMASAYKHYFLSSIFPWILMFHFSATCGLLYFAAWSAVDSFSSLQGLEFALTGLSCGASGAIHWHALRQYVHLKYYPHFLEETNGNQP